MSDAVNGRTTGRLYSGNHVFLPGDRVKVYRLALIEPPQVSDAHVVTPVTSVANLYLGRLWGEQKFSQFFAHPALQSEEVERALLEHFIVTCDPRHLYRKGS